MRRNRLVVMVLVALLLVVLAGGCARPPAPAKKGVKVAVLLPSLAGYVYVAKAYGVLDEAEKLGIERPAILAAGGYDKLDVQVKQVDDMVAAGVDSIIIMPLSYEAMVPALDRAVDKGVKIVEMGNVSASKKVQARVRTDQADIGVRLARWIGKALNGKGNIVMFNGPAGASWSQLETNAFKKTLAEEFPGVKILGERWAVYDAGVAMNIMNDYLQAFPNIDYVYAAWEAYAEGAARAIEAAGKKGQIRMATVGMSEVTLSLLKEGLLDMVIGANPVIEGRMCLQAAVKLAKGEQVPALQYTPLTEFTREEVVNNPNIDLSGNFYPKGWTVPK